MRGLLCLAALNVAAAGAARGVPPSLSLATLWSSSPGQPPQPDLVSACDEHFVDMPLDHFAPVPSQHTFPLRYYTCEQFWSPTPEGAPGPVLFYAGNEADVQLYVNHTGLMWETAPRLGALLVFAEHRYYGKSWPFPETPSDPASRTRPELLAYLTTEQALADYAALVVHLKRTLDAAASPVIALGGSYGGMLAAWARVRYPWLFDGAIAASAPIWALQDFPAHSDDTLDTCNGLTLGADPGGFAAVITHDASSAGGAAPACVPNLRQSWQALFSLGADRDGRKKLHTVLRLCPAVKLDDADDVTDLAFWLQSAWDYLAMGNFPYESDYLLNGGGTPLPRWPIRAACAHLANASLAHDPDALLMALSDAAAVFYNASGNVRCFSPDAGPNDDTSLDADLWTWQACTDMTMPMSRDGVHDAFWPQPWNGTAFADTCAARFGGIRPADGAAAVAYGGRRFAWSGASNIVFSNGALDPWSSTGVLRSLSRSLVAITIEGGAHHLDLMFSHPDDPQSVRDARKEEQRHMERWIREAYARQEARSPEDATADDGLGGAWSARATQLFIAGAAGACIASGIAAVLLVCMGPASPALRPLDDDARGGGGADSVFTTPAAGQDSAGEVPLPLSTPRAGGDPMRQPLLGDVGASS